MRLYCEKFRFMYTTVAVFECGNGTTK